MWFDIYSQDSLFLDCHFLLWDPIECKIRYKGWVSLLFYEFRENLYFLDLIWRLYSFTHSPWVNFKSFNSILQEYLDGGSLHDTCYIMRLNLYEINHLTNVSLPVNIKDYDLKFKTIIWVFAPTTYFFLGIKFLQQLVEYK